MTERMHDPIELAIFGNLVAAVAEEACSALERTAYTTFVKEANDFAVALADPSGTFFAYPRKSGVTTFIGLPLAEVIQGVADWQPGDVLLTNDPYTTGGLVTHSPDFNLIAPVFFAGEIVAFCWGFIHSSDVGGSTPGSIAPSNREIFQEGIRIPPMKLYRAGTLNHELYDIIKANVRIPYQVWGDINALTSSFHVAAARLQEIFGKYGIARARALMDECLRYAEAKARAVIAEIPSGTYRFVDYLDDDIASNLPVRICLALTVAGSDVHLDFTGTDPQVLAAFNLATAGKAVARVADHRARPLPVDRGPGDTAQRRRAAAIASHRTGRHAGPCRVPGVARRTDRERNPRHGRHLRGAHPGSPRASAGGRRRPGHAAGDLDAGADDGGRKVNILQPLVGGSGGRPAADGYDGTDYSLGFLKNSPVEVLESEMDVLVQRYHYLADFGWSGEISRRPGHRVRVRGAAAGHRPVDARDGADALRAMGCAWRAMRRPDGGRGGQSRPPRRAAYRQARRAPPRRRRHRRDRYLRRRRLRRSVRARPGTGGQGRALRIRQPKSRRERIWRRAQEAATWTSTRTRRP